MNYNPISIRDGKWSSKPIFSKTKKVLGLLMKRIKKWAIILFPAGMSVQGGTNNPCYILTRKWGMRYFGWSARCNNVLCDPLLTSAVAAAAPAAPADHAEQEDGVEEVPHPNEQEEGGGGDNMDRIVSYIIPLRKLKKVKKIVIK